MRRENRDKATMTQVVSDKLRVEPQCGKHRGKHT